MAVRSRSLALLATLPVSTLTTLYTVPPGRTAVLRVWTAVNRTGADTVVRFRVRSASGTAADIHSVSIAQERGTALPFDDLVLSPGWSAEVVRSGGGASDSLMVYLAGSLLEGEPT